MSHLLQRADALARAEREIAGTAEGSPVGRLRLAALDLRAALRRIEELEGSGRVLHCSEDVTTEAAYCPEPGCGALAVTRLGSGVVACGSGHSFRVEAAT